MSNHYRQRGYPLSPKLERVAKDSDRDITDLRLLEHKVIFEFMRRAHNYSEFNWVDTTSVLELLSIIQNYGGPTRLIDFSHSIYIACFFAISGSNHDAAVWVADKEALLSNSHKIVYPDKYNQTEYDPSSNNGVEIFDKFMEAYGSREIDMIDIFEKSFLDYDTQYNVVIPVEPTSMTQRLSLQKGLFLAQCSTKYSFSECMLNTMGIDLSDDSKKRQFNFNLPEKETENDLSILSAAYNDTGIIKIIIPKNCHSFILKELWQMGLNDELLFPGLDGLARSLSFYLKPIKVEEKYQKFIFQRLSDSLINLGKH